MKVKEVTVCVVLITAVAVIGGMVLGRHPGPAPDPLAEWTYPNAKQDGAEMVGEEVPTANGHERRVAIRQKPHPLQGMDQ